MRRPELENVKSISCMVCKRARAQRVSKILLLNISTYRNIIWICITISSMVIGLVSTFDIGSIRTMMNLVTIQITNSYINLERWNDCLSHFHVLNGTNQPNSLSWCPASIAWINVRLIAAGVYPTASMDFCLVRNLQRIYIFLYRMNSRIIYRKRVRVK